MLGWVVVVGSHRLIQMALSFCLVFIYYSHLPIFKKKTGRGRRVAQTFPFFSLVYFVGSALRVSSISSLLGRPSISLKTTRLARTKDFDCHCDWCWCTVKNWKSNRNDQHITNLSRNKKHTPSYLALRSLMRNIRI